MPRAKQTDLVLKYMRDFGSINQIDALRDLGIMRLASRIADLRSEGYDITMTLTKGRNRYGDVTRYAEYSLNEHKRQEIKR